MDKTWPVGMKTGEHVRDCTALQQPAHFTLISIHGTEQQLQPPDTRLWASLKNVSSAPPGKSHLLPARCLCRFRMLKWEQSKRLNPCVCAHRWKATGQIIRTEKETNKIQINVECTCGEIKGLIFIERIHRSAAFSCKLHWNHRQ